MLLYDVNYYTVQGRLLAPCDRDVPLPDREKAPRGQVARYRCTNWDHRVIWIDSHGRRRDRPPWEPGARRPAGED